LVNCQTVHLPDGCAVDVDQEIPRDLYKAVAEVLAFIYRLKNQRMAS